MEDEVLLERILSGDREAVRELVNRHQLPLVRVVRYYVSSDAPAQDVAQDTWIAVMRGMQKFEGRCSFKTWLFRIAANRARKTGPREHRTISVDPVDPVASARSNEGECGLNRPSPSPNS